MKKKYGRHRFGTRRTTDSLPPKIPSCEQNNNKYRLYYQKKIFSNIEAVKFESNQTSFDFRHSIFFYLDTDTTQHRHNTALLLNFCVLFCVRAEFVKTRSHPWCCKRAFEGATRKWIQAHTAPRLTTSFHAVVCVKCIRFDSMWSLFIGLSHHILCLKQNKFTNEKCNSNYRITHSH